MVPPMDRATALSPALRNWARHRGQSLLDEQVEEPAELILKEEQCPPPPSRGLAGCSDSSGMRREGRLGWRWKGLGNIRRDGGNRVSHHVVGGGGGGKVEGEFCPAREGELERVRG